MGQVHRASLGGREVAVKVRYPGVLQTLDADPRQLRLIAGLAPADPLAHRDRSLRVGRPIGADVAESEGRRDFRATKDGDLHRIHVGPHIHVPGHHHDRGGDPGLGLAGGGAGRVVTAAGAQAEGREG